MKVKSYKGKSLDKIYRTVQKDLGPKAVIVSSRKCSQNGLMGVLGGTMYELVAVADDHSSDKSLLDKTINGEVFSRFSEMQALQFTRMEQAVRELRAEMRTLKRDPATYSAPPSVKPTETLPAYAQGWDPRFVRRVRSQMPRFFSQGQISKQRDVLASLLRVEEHFPVRQTGRPHTVVLVGPTGSGKTTTVAKLASRWGLDLGLKAGLITTDTYRVAAVDQIKEYAPLLGLDLKVVFGPDEARRASDGFMDRDVLLVDPAGRNHYDQASLKELRTTLEALGPFTVLLTLPAGTSKDMLPEMIRNYEVLKPDYLVITKIDETRNYDMLTTARCESTCPVAFLTNGQRVPQDIEAAGMNKLVKMLLQK